MHHACAVLLVAVVAGGCRPPAPLRGGPPAVGPAAIRAYLGTFAAYRVLASRLTVDVTRAAADTAVQASTFWQHARLPAGDTVQAHGRFDARWIRTPDGAWLLRRLVTTPDPTPPVR